MISLGVAMGCRGYSSVWTLRQVARQVAPGNCSLSLISTTMSAFSPCLGLEHCSTCSGVNLCLIVMERWGQLYS